MAKKQARSYRRWVMALAVLLIVVSSISLFITNNIYDSERFSQKVTTAVTSDPAIEAIANEITDEVLKDQPPLRRAVLDKPVNSLARGALESDVFSNLFARFTKNLNQFLTTRNFEPITIDLSGITPTIDKLADAVDPDNNLNLSERENQEIVLLEDTELPPFKDIGQFFLIMGPLTAIGLIIILVFAWMKTENKIHLIRDGGIVLLISSVVLYLVTFTSGSLLTISIIDPNASVVMSQIYDTFIANFRTYLLVMFLLGVTLYSIFYFNTKNVSLKTTNKRKSKT